MAHTEHKLACIVMISLLQVGVMGVPGCQHQTHQPHPAAAAPFAARVGAAAGDLGLRSRGECHAYNC
jgi:hypothetical protein